MIIFINGSFGVGKTTVAKLLVGRMPRSTLFDPEIIGFVLRRLPRFILLSDCGTDDYQDFPLWRRLTALTALVIHKTVGRTIIIPMTFYNLDYLNQIRSELLRGGVTVHHFCLTAPVEVVYERLKKRGVNPSLPEGQWVYQKAARCCEIHAAPGFSKHINTDKQLPSEIVDNILKRIHVA